MASPWKKAELGTDAVAVKLGDWTRGELIGTGASALAYRTTRPVVDGHHQEACWKQLRQELQSVRDYVHYFRRELAIAADLRDPNIVSLIEAHLDHYVIIYELVDGCDLRRVLEAAADGQRLSAAVITHIGIETCRALDTAHTHTRDDKPAGIIHRDLCPKNILISKKGDVKLMDFGAATRITEPNSGVRGKEAYMSPEQARGEKLDGRSDLYSLGVILFEALTGQLPYDARDSTMSARIAAGSLEPFTKLAPDAPKELVDIISQLLRPNREDRIANADACFDAFARISSSRLVTKELGKCVRKAYRRTTKDYALLDRQSTPAAPLSSLLSHRRRPSRWRWAAPAAAIVLAAPAAALTASGHFPGAPTSPPAHGPQPQPRTQALVHATEQAPAAESTATPTPPPTPISLTASVVRAPDASDTSPAPAEPEPHERLAADHRATLHINAAPPSEVFVDNRSHGRSPVHVRVSPGRHVIAVGNVKRPVTVRAGEERDEIFDLTQTN